MATKVIRTAWARNLTTLEGLAQASLVFQVWDDTNPIRTEDEAWTALRNAWFNVYPAAPEPLRLGAQHPEGGYENQMAIDVDIIPEPGGDLMWRVTIQYVLATFRNISNFGEFLYAGGAARAQFLPAFRRNGVIPDGMGGNTIDEPDRSVDIQGDKIDAGGKPVSLPVRTQSFQLLQVVNMNQTFTVGGVSDLNIFGAIDSVAGHRNSMIFATNAVGVCLYEGANFTRIGVVEGLTDPEPPAEPGPDGNFYDVFLVTHSFITDGKFAHLRQEATRGLDSLPGRRQHPDIPATERLDVHAEHVFWIQPFPDTSDFEEVFKPTGGLWAP